MTTNEQHVQLDTILEQYETLRARRDALNAALDQAHHQDEFNIARMVDDHAAVCAVARAVLKYSELCDSEQDLTGRAGVAFVQTLHLVAKQKRAEGLTEEAITHQEERYEAWALATADAGEMIEAAPTLPAADDLVAAVAAWWEHLREERIDQALARTAAAAQAAGAQNIREETGVTEDGRPFRRLAWDMPEPDDDEEELALPAEDALAPGAVIPASPRHRLRATFSRSPWRVVRRQYGQTRWLEDGTAYKVGPQAFEEAQAARLDLTRTEVIDIYHLDANGWLLVDSLPPLTAGEVALPNGELVRGEIKPASQVDGTNTDLLAYGVIGAIFPAGTQWEARIRISGEDGVRRPIHDRHALHPTRLRAIAAVRAIWAQHQDHQPPDAAAT